MTEPNTQRRIDFEDYVSIDTTMPNKDYAGHWAYVLFVHYPINDRQFRRYNLRVFTLGDTTTGTSYLDVQGSFGELELHFRSKNEVPQQILDLQRDPDEAVPDEAVPAAQSTVPTQSTVIDFCDEFKALIQRN